MGNKVIHKARPLNPVGCKNSNERYDIVNIQYYRYSVRTMTHVIQPFHLLVVALAGWLNRHQQAVIEYLMEENRVLKDQLDGKRLRFTDDQRRRLAAKAKVLGRQLLDEIDTLVTPDTLLAWHRKLIAEKWTFSRKGPGRPRIAQEIIDLVLRMARENDGWGYDRIQGALANLGYMIAPNTVKNILKRHGIEPAPERRKRTSWKTFLKAHWDVMARMVKKLIHIEISIS